MFEGGWKVGFRFSIMEEVIEGRGFVIRVEY